MWSHAEFSIRYILAHPARHNPVVNAVTAPIALPQESKSFLDRVIKGSGSDLVKQWESGIARKSRMLITDQVATAPCTDPIQLVIPTFEGKPAPMILPVANGKLRRLSQMGLSQLPVALLSDYPPVLATAGKTRHFRGCGQEKIVKIVHCGLH